jgi:hypothetical protein
MIGSVTGNDNTVGGGGVYPIADLKELEGLELGCKKPIAMMDGYNFNGAKAYKDTKLALMMTSNMLHERFHKSTGIAFSSIYPGCIAETPLFREKRAWFRKYFPIFMKYITGGFIGEAEAGQRLFQVLHDLRCQKSGIYWGWNGGAREGRGVEAMDKGGQILGAGGAGGGWDSIFENDQSDKVLNKDLMMKLWKYSCEITGAQWPEAYQPKSPCPTLVAVGAATSFLGVLEESARMKASRGGAGAKIVANMSMPREERRKYLAEMLLKLDKTPSDAEQLEDDLLRTSGQVPEIIAAEMEKRKAKREAALAEAAKQEKVGLLGKFKPKEAAIFMVKLLTTILVKFLDLAKAILAPIFAKIMAKPIEASKEVMEEEVKEAKPVIPTPATLSVDDAKVPDVQFEAEDPKAVVAVAAGEKGPPQMLPGHEKLGDVPIVFQPQNIMTMGRVGQPLSEVASRADIFIRYKCRKGECKTCVVKIDGKWESACQTKIPPVAPGQHFELTTRNVTQNARKDDAVFFSPKSLVDGGVNNALGMVGFVRDGMAADPDFQHRMETEKRIQELTAKKKEREEASLRR